MSVISAAAFRDQLDRWGVDFVEHTRHDRCLGRTVDWSEHEARRGSDCARRGWDAHGIAIHHSGGPTSWEFVWDGRSDVPGPLYTVLIYPDGKAHLTGFRITNNVGRCDATVRNRVLRGDMPTSGGSVSPGGDDYSVANSEFYGISYRGTAPNAAQRKTALLICAAICSAHGSDWDGGSVAGHKELTRRKPDPEGENMSAFRSDLNKLLATGPDGTTQPQEDDDMPYRDWPEADKNAMIRDMLDAKLARGNGPVQMTPWAAEQWPEHLATGVGQMIGYTAVYARGANGHASTARKLAASLEAKVQALLDAQEGLDTGAILARIDQRHDEAEAQRAAILAALDGSDPAEAKLAAILEILGVDA